MLGMPSIIKFVLTRINENITLFTALNFIPQFHGKLDDRVLYKHFTGADSRKS